MTIDECIVKSLMPILKGRADVYITGHDHNLEHLKPVDGANLFIAGGGGGVTYEVDPVSPVALLAKQTNGFAALEIDDHTNSHHLGHQSSVRFRASTQYAQTGVTEQCRESDKSNWRPPD